jgi:hypothetical protein
MRRSGTSRRSRAYRAVPTGLAISGGVLGGIGISYAYNKIRKKQCLSDRSALIYTMSGNRTIVVPPLFRTLSKDLNLSKKLYLINKPITADRILIDTEETCPLSDPMFTEHDVETLLYNEVVCKILGAGRNLFNKSDDKKTVLDEISEFITLNNISILITDGDDYKTDSFMHILPLLLDKHTHLKWYHIRIEETPENKAKRMWRYFDMPLSQGNGESTESLLTFQTKYGERLSFFRIRRDESFDTNHQGKQTIDFADHLIVLGYNPQLLNTTTHHEVVHAFMPL